MTSFSRLAFSIAVISGLSGFALAQAPAPHHHGAQPSDAPATRDFKEAHKKMMHDMEIAYSGNTDVDFVRGMIPHHQGAIAMARVQLAHGKDPAIRSLAQQIIADQEKEIAQMQEWLKKNAN
jgi:uncharacterized protein (DUF305 family)